MPHYLVTGGAGFIGFHVASALLGRGDTVTILDDFSDAPYPRAHKERNVQDLRAMLSLGGGALGRELRLVRACVTDARTVRDALAGAEGVLHLAGLAGVRPSFASPARYARVNVEGTAVVLEAARDLGVRRFVLASSSSVYGNSTPLPAHEDSPAVAPESPYAATKRGAELVASALCRRAPELACPALRFHTVYGPRQRPEMAISTFARALIAGRPITLFGDGSMRRDFTHVDDITRGILAALDRAPPGFRPYNLGSRSPVDLVTLVHALGEAAGVRADAVRIEHAPVPLGDVEATYADVSRAEAELAWTPHIRLTEGLKTVIDWVRANPKP